MQWRCSVRDCRGSLYGCSGVRALRKRRNEAVWRNPEKPDGTYVPVRPVSDFFLHPKKIVPAVELFADFFHVRDFFVSHPCVKLEAVLG